MNRKRGRKSVRICELFFSFLHLLRELLPALEAWAPVVWADRVAPFGTSLKDLYRALRILEEALGAR
jgi:hypothetical protein